MTALDEGPDQDNGPAVVAYLQARNLAPAGLVAPMRWARSVRDHLRQNNAGHKVVWSVAEESVTRSDHPHLVMLERDAGAYRWAVFYIHLLVAVARDCHGKGRDVRDEYDLDRRVQIPLWNGQKPPRDRNGPAARPTPAPAELATMEGPA